MKIVIIGNGVAGTFSAQNIRNLDKDVSIHLYSKENYPYYTRIKLPQLISEQVTISDLIVFNKNWYVKNNIELNLNSEIKKIDTLHKQVFLNNNSLPIHYDKLILATGSLPNIPPIKNAKKFLRNGVFTLRSIQDALDIKNFIVSKKVQRVIIIGGGLLGLELAKQIKNRDLDTTIVEFFPRLLPKQLDFDCGTLLKEEIESMGINVILDAATEEILSEQEVITGILIKNGTKIDADLVLIQAGIRPTIDLAVEAGIKCNRGIIVNQYLETSMKNVFAVGDCIEYNEQTWGIIPACMEQAKIVASTVLGKRDKAYKGTIPKNTLKIIGIDLTSIGLFDPSDKDLVGAGWEILKNIDKKSKCYKKIVLKNKKLKGAILFGGKKAVPYISKNIESEINEDELRKVVELFKWRCKNCNYVYDDAKNDILFKELPDDWKCKCDSPKTMFERNPDNI
ncbi:MAG: FAD-dependent oxidoreductase [Promethearchaeota archaeon]